MNAIYQVNLEDLIVEEKELPLEYIKVSINDSKGKNLSQYESVDKTLNESKSAHKLTTGVLKVGETKKFSLRLWLDEKTPTIDEVMNATFKSKITLIMIQKENTPQISITADEYFNGIQVEINTLENLNNEEIKYFYQLNNEEEISSIENAYTFTELKDGKYTIKARGETEDGTIIEEKIIEIIIAYETVYISNIGDDIAGNGSRENPYASLKKAYDKVKSGGEMILLSDLIANDTLKMDIENKEVTLKSDEQKLYSISRGNTLKTQIINMSNSTILTTSNIIFDGNSVKATTAILQGYKIKLNLTTGTTIKNALRAETKFGGAGIQVDGNSELNISDTIIENNLFPGTDTEGGGINVSSGSVCNFYSGIIRNNQGGVYGGGIYVWESTLNVYGGTISNNRATTYGGGIYALRASNPSIVNIYGGTITNNTAQTGANVYARNGDQINDYR